MAKLVTIAHQKGGVGKSTLTVNIAYIFAESYKVAILDIDPQGSINSIKKLIENITILPNDTKVSGLAQLDFDLIFIDTPPYLSDKMVEIFGMVDLVVIPTKAAYFDVLAVRSTVGLVKQAAKKRPQLKAFVVLNMVKQHTTLTEETSKEIEKLNIHLYEKPIYDRVATTRAPVLQGIQNTGDEKAIEEFRGLSKRIGEIVFS